VSVRLVDRGITAVLLDIEGTTTPLAFVRDVLFPYAHTHLPAWIARHRQDEGFAALILRFEAERAEDVRRGEPVPEWRSSTPEAQDASLQAYAGWLMARDRKSPALKWLQAQVWEEGFQSGVLRGEVFDDVPRAIRRWHEAGLVVAIYSSGSELAQRRLFSSTADGDLTPYVTAYFDTAVGAKREAESYRRIAVALGRSAQEILFVSDVVEELEAAYAAGCHGVLSLRPGNALQPDGGGFDGVRTFDDLE